MTAITDVAPPSGHQDYKIKYNLKAISSQKKKWVCNERFADDVVLYVTTCDWTAVDLPSLICEPLLCLVSFPFLFFCTDLCIITWVTAVSSTEQQSRLEHLDTEMKSDKYDNKLNEFKFFFLLFISITYFLLSLKSIARWLDKTISVSGLSVSPFIVFITLSCVLWFPGNLSH